MKLKVVSSIRTPCSWEEFKTFIKIVEEISKEKNLEIKNVMSTAAEISIELHSKKEEEEEK